MAIVINGSGTVTGLAVGGLPDGTVDAGTLATDSVVTGKIADGTIANADIADLAASKLTGALPAISGAALTNIVAGKILQVVYSTSNTATYPTTSYTTITGASIQITPSATSSKILYIYNCGGLLSGTTNNMSLKLERGGSAIRTYDRWGYNTVAGYQPAWFTFMYIDSPSTTSQITYSLDAKEAASATWEINDSVGTGPGSMVMAMEIGA